MTVTVENDERRAAADDEITIQRRVLVAAVTTRLTKIDSRLLAIARGELDPDADPFGGLIPVYDDVVLDEVDEDRTRPDVDVDADVEASSPESVLAQVVPRQRVRMVALFDLPVGERSTFFFSQIDGRRTVGDIVAACGFDDLEGLEIFDGLLRVGAIELT